MDNKILLDKDMTRVLDILEQVKTLNGMISLHKTNDSNSFMLNQYLDVKNRFLEELKVILINYEIDVQIKQQAA